MDIDDTLAAWKRLIADARRNGFDTVRVETDMLDELVTSYEIWWSDQKQNEAEDEEDKGLDDFRERLKLHIENSIREFLVREGKPVIESVTVSEDGTLLEGNIRFPFWTMPPGPGRKS